MNNTKRKYDRDYHANRSPEKKKQKQQKQKERLQCILLEVRDIKSESGCLDCGENDPIVLEFDHRNPDEKECNVSDMVKRGRSIKSIKKEIEKCDVVCANCHRKRTAKQFGWK